MNIRFKLVLLINLVCLVVIASVAALSLPYLYQQQKTSVGNEVKAALSLFEISARRAVNIQNTETLKFLANELLKSPSINYVKVTDQTSQQVLLEAGDSRQTSSQDGQTTNKLAALIDNQQQPASQVNPIAWVEIEFVSPSNLYQWLYPHRLKIINLLMLLFLIQLFLSLVVSRAGLSTKPASIGSANQPKPKETTSPVENSAGLAQSHQELQETLHKTQQQQHKEKQKLNQIIALSKRANSIKKTLLEQSQQALVMVDEHNHIIEASPKALKILACSKEQLLKLDLNQHFSLPPQSAQDSPEFMELLLSYPEDFYLLAQAQQQAYAVNHLALRFDKDSLYLLNIVERPPITSKAEPVAQARWQALQLSDLYSPLKAGCLAAMQQLQTLKANTEANQQQSLDAQLRLTTLLACLPWQQNQSQALKLQAENFVELFEQRLSHFSALYQANRLRWALVISPEVKQHYLFNYYHMQALIDLHLYLISLYPAKAQVLLQINLEQQQLVVSLDAENASLLSPLQQSLLACSAALCKQIGARQQQQQDSLALRFSLEPATEVQLNPVAKEQAVTIDIADTFVQQCLKLQLQLLGYRVLELSELAQCESSEALSYICQQLPNEQQQASLQDKNIALILLSEQVPEPSVVPQAATVCLRARLASFAARGLASVPHYEQSELQVLTQAMLAIEDTKPPAEAINIASFSQQQNPFKALANISSPKLAWKHREWQQAYNQIRNLGPVDYLLLEASALNQERIKQLNLLAVKPQLLIYQDQAQNEYLSQLSDFRLSLLQPEQFQQQLWMLLLNHQHYQQNLESLNSDEQLWEAQLLGELNTLAIIQALSQIGAQQPAGIHQHQELPPSSTMQPYEKALNQVFKRETKERAQLIIEFAHEQRWREVQQQLTAIQFSAEKFASDSLNQQIEALSKATYQQDNAALEKALAQLSG
ncbi:hypothetical protein [Agarivorans gilvus]|uniref:PAS domain-containing protein n=1 Tax=Agarivorans gilvus TaxID=680279 RepID=A0ABQ1HY73_9ALTE|nr:hypothetical protein [Agarivorans gilvus]GGA93371.1 hypothetical protein GCM10007414_02560 [Agarivorans gilvus]